VACANHWTKGMEVISGKVLKKTSISISSCMEAAKLLKNKNIFVEFRQF